MTCKIGDRVLFTFIGEKLKGVVTAKEGTTAKIKGDDGYNYSSIWINEPKSKKEKPLGIILEKL